MSPGVLEVEEDWSSACMSVRKRCVLDLTSITYARALIGLKLCWKCLWVSWTCFGSRVGAICQLSASTWTHFGVLESFGMFRRVLCASWQCFGACLKGFWRILGRLEGPLEVASRRFSELWGWLGGNIAFGITFLMLCEGLRGRFSVNFLLKTDSNSIKYWLHVYACW